MPGSYFSEVAILGGMAPNASIIETGDKGLCSLKVTRYCSFMWEKWLTDYQTAGTISKQIHLKMCNHYAVVWIIGHNGTWFIYATEAKMTSNFCLYKFICSCNWFSFNLNVIWHFHFLVFLPPPFLADPPLVVSFRFTHVRVCVRASVRVWSVN